MSNFKSNIQSKHFYEAGIKKCTNAFCSGKDPTRIAQTRADLDIEIAVWQEL